MTESHSLRSEREPAYAGFLEQEGSGIRTELLRRRREQKSEALGENRFDVQTKWEEPKRFGGRGIPTPSALEKHARQGDVFVIWREARYLRTERVRRRCQGYRNESEERGQSDTIFN